MSVFPKYPKYKDSGVEWLGEIPEHWEVRKLKFISHIVLGKMLKTKPSKNEQLKPYLRSANIQWFKSNLLDVSEMWFSSYEMNRYRLLKNDILVSEGGEVGRACIWNNEIKECYIQNSVHKITTLSKIIPQYLLYQFFDFGKKEVFKMISNCVSIAHLTREKLINIHFCIPPISEQQAIANFLNWKTIQINKFVRSKKKLIQLLKEEKQVIINHAVTKGLNPDAPLKNSGVEWLGEIPEHWEVKKLNRLLRVKSGDMISSSEESETGYPIYGGNGIRGYTNKWNTKGTTILIGRVGAKCGCIHIVDGNFWASEHALRVILISKINLDFLARVLENLNFNQFAIRTAQPLINSTIIRSKYILVPPISEQQAIADYLNQKTAEIDLSISRAEKEIALIEEYKTRLISDAVTGKIDVRGIEVPEYDETELNLIEVAENEEDETLDLENEAITSEE